FPLQELRVYLANNIAQARAAGARLSPIFPTLGARLNEIASAAEVASALLDAPGNPDLEDLERRLTVLDDKVYAAVTADASEELLLRVRRELDGQLAMYRRKMSAEQIALVEKQYLQKRLLQEVRVSRFSLYYFS
ncbi:MAG TPA: hypothetical protein VE545_02780, partial [Candidatus Dormibacteraeota bacterium]|nr:hypothetical protein [Candidatus Dormibacteraeota bacterium]